MPPKKAAGAAQAAKAVNKKQTQEKDVPDRTKEEQQAKSGELKDEEKEEAKAGQKRKTPPASKAEKPPKKEPRQGARASARSAGKLGSGATVTSKQMLNFLLSKDALEYCYPADELEAAHSGKFSKNYSLTPPSLFTPFEHLVTAHLLSKPLSHVLGMRSVRTLLNPPYGYSTPEEMKKAGEDKIYQALEEAKTQHRQKTAAYLFEMAELYAGDLSKDASSASHGGDSDTMLDLAEAANDGGPRATISHLKSTVKGLGDIGGQIFCRRVQACDGWGEAIWPYADSKAMDALREVGIKIADADELQEMIEQDVDWDKVGDMGLVREKEGVDEQDYDVQVAVEFVTVLERALGAVLEDKVGQLKKAAAEWT